MRNSRRFPILLVLMILAASVMMCARARAVDSTMELISRAVSQIDRGKYNNAIESLDAALAVAPGEPVGRLALAVALSHTRKVDLAIEEYRDILASDPKNALAAYGLGTCYLSLGKLDQANVMFLRAAKSTELRQSGTAVEYIRFLYGRPLEALSESSEDPARKFLSAAELRKKGRNDKAHPILLDIIEQERNPRYDENYGAIITLDRKSPIAFTGETLERLPEMRVSAKKGMRAVKGEVQLTPDSSVYGADYVIFQIDGSLAAVVNREPFQFSWDTAKYTNGIHSVTISGRTNSGAESGGTAKRYWVQNANAANGSRIPRAEAVKLLANLWNCARIRPSLKLSYYYAGKYCLLRSDTRAAPGFLEKAAACDPDYADTRALLSKCYGRHGYAQISRAPGAGKLVALTFDDGPNTATQNVLDILDKYDVKATFFVVGSQVEPNRELVRTMARNGHDIQSHTFSHMNLEQLSEKETERELLRCAAAIRDATDKESAFFRPPGGHLGKYGEAAAAKYGFTGVFWTLACSSFEESSARRMTQYIDSSVGDGGILLMHNGEDVTLKALPAIISDLKGKGYTFVTLSELVGRR
ncbi:MAG: polysaccharide deacetylase family protein [Armatimonadota bacterium]|nr:polysaccharide deacetylase family protein [Armatimonadota bacterium]